MQAKDLKPVSAGQEITARMWNDLLDVLNRSELNAGQGSGISLQKTSVGTSIALSPTFSWFLCVANGNIPARSSSAAGLGSVYMVKVEPTISGGAITGVSLSTSSIPIPVYNPSSGTMTSGNGIDSGMYCWITEYPSGLFCVSPLECS